MHVKKTLQELTFKDNFMFAAVMMDKENAKGVIELALGIEVDHIEVSYEKSIVYNPEYKGIRLDVFAKDADNTCYCVEMQVANKKIKKRARYYHSQIDMDLLIAGCEYENLPDSYVIFICDYDPIGLKKYKYAICQKLAEDNNYAYEDGIHTVFLSTVGQNEDEVSKELVSFLNYVSAGNVSRECEDTFVSRLQKSVEKIKYDREMGRRYMLFEEMMRDEFKAGKQEGLQEGELKGRLQSIIDIISDLAPISAELKQRILSIQDSEAASKLIKGAVNASTISEFEELLNSMNL